MLRVICEVRLIYGFTRSENNSIHLILTSALALFQLTPVI